MTTRVHWQDRRTVVVTARRDGRTASSSLRWPDAATADRNAPAAIAELRASLLDDLTSSNAYERVWMRRTRLGTVGLAVMCGPPTWWKPDLRLLRPGNGTLELRTGWLRACLQLWWKRP